MARPPSTAYRLQKSVRRNKLAFAAAAAVAAALVVGIAVSTWQAMRGDAGQDAEQVGSAEAEAADGAASGEAGAPGGQTELALRGQHEPGAASLGAEQHRAAAAIAGRDRKTIRSVVLNGITGNGKLTWP